MCKANGARVAEVMAMLNKDFVRWVVIAFVIATPVAKMVSTVLRRDLSLPKSLTLVVKNSYTLLSKFIFKDLCNKSI